MALSPTIASLESLLPFSKFGFEISKAHKTGLGSSAALTCSLVSALLLHLEVVDSESLIPSTQPSRGLKLAHNLSQYVHCLAQGKIGSGFDISTGVFGSQQYRRFDPRVLDPLMTDLVRTMH
jgi:phosphomevalonate kinase